MEGVNHDPTDPVGPRGDLHVLNKYFTLRDVIVALPCLPVLAAGRGVGERTDIFPSVPGPVTGLPRPPGPAP